MSLPSTRAAATWLALAVLIVVACASPAWAQTAPAPAAPVTGDGGVNVNLNFGAGGARESLSDLMKIVLVLSLLTLAPAILLTMTSFTRIIIVMSFVRRALSLQMPPNEILIGFSLFLTAFVMAPTVGKINTEAVQPAMKGEITEIEAIRRAETPLRDFMLRQTRKKDVALFARIAKLERPRTADDVPTWVLLPSFALSEIKTAFQMGFVVFLPMLVVDIVVAVLLTAMGMFMLPPNMVSVPLKVLLFILVDGWSLVIGSLANSFK